MKICLSCTHGGHFVEMMHLLDAFKGHDYFFVTYKSEARINIKNAYFIKFEEKGFRAKMMLIKTLIEALKILIKEKPDVIISTGGGEIAVPFSYIGKVLGMKVIFIETLARINTPSGGGKLIYPIADLFLVQWESLLKKYGTKAKYWGKVI
ncbi:Oligosaccharide biosynthesis protein Alg14 like protein [uncultured archaeon]|nr:Oligosaccharide biosynthesis protein Alg14 like protein [uncultured archaeon]